MVEAKVPWISYESCVGFHYVGPARTLFGICRGCDTSEVMEGAAWAAATSPDALGREAVEAFLKQHGACDKKGLEALRERLAESD